MKRVAILISIVVFVYFFKVGFEIGSSIEVEYKYKEDVIFKKGE